MAKKNRPDVVVEEWYNIMFCLSKAELKEFRAAIHEYCPSSNAAYTMKRKVQKETRRLN
jgi:hypothetical protein